MMMDAKVKSIAVIVLFLGIVGFVFWMGSKDPWLISPTKKSSSDVWKDTAPFAQVTIPLTKGQSIRLTQKSLVHILQRHHPRYFDAAQCKEHNTLFPDSMSVGDVVAVVRSLVQHHRNEIASSLQRIERIEHGDQAYFKLKGRHGDSAYAIGFYRFDVVQLYPLQGEEASECPRHRAG